MTKLWLETKTKPSSDTLESQRQLKVDFKAKINRQHKQNATKKVCKDVKCNLCRVQASRELLWRLPASLSLLSLSCALIRHDMRASHSPPVHTDLQLHKACLTLLLLTDGGHSLHREEFKRSRCIFSILQTFRISIHSTAHCLRVWFRKFDSKKRWVVGVFPIRCPNLHSCGKMKLPLFHDDRKY